MSKNTPGEQKHSARTTDGTDDTAIIVAGNDRELLDRLTESERKRLRIAVEDALKDAEETVLGAVEEFDESIRELDQDQKRLLLGEECTMADDEIIVAGDDAEIIADGGLLECPDCDETFVRESSLRQHKFFSGHGGGE